MNKFKIYKSSSALVYGGSVVLALSLIGCSDGGMIGTGSGPTHSTYDSYQLKNLPNRISPDIPKTLQNEEALPPSDSEKGWNVALRNVEIEPEKSGGWRELSSELTQVAVMRFQVELNTAIIDLAFDEIVNQCGQQLIDCIIPADQIRITVDQSLVNRWLNQHAAKAQSLSTTFGAEVVAESIRSARAEINAMLNNDVVLGEIHYSRLDGAPYDHVVRTRFRTEKETTPDGYPLFMVEEIFTARWHDDGHVAKFTFDEAVGSVRDYFYENNIPGELVVSNYSYINDDGTESGLYTKILGNDVDQDGVLVQAATKTQVFDSNNGGAVGKAFAVFEGQLDNSGGYSSIDGRHFDLTEEQNLTYRYRHRHSYDVNGYLLASESCVFDVATPNLNCQDEFEWYRPYGLAITDSPHYFAPGELDSLVAIQDAIRWKLEGVPSEIKSVAIVFAESTNNLSDSELLCQGIQVAADNAPVFCTATDEQLDNTVVVELVDGMPNRVIPTAKLVQVP